MMKPALDNYTPVSYQLLPQVPYYHPLSCADNIIISCDMLKFRFYLFKNITPNIHSGVENFFYHLKVIDAEWQTDFFVNCNPMPQRKIGGYKYFVNIIDGYEGSMRCSAGLYSADGMHEVIDVELNPNKCFSHISPITELFQWLTHHSQSISLRWFDLAADYYGVNRTSVASWIGDRRIPISYGHGKTMQRSYGKNKKHGYLKIYNKADERIKGTDGITRIELTLKAPFDIDEAQRLFGTHVCDAGTTFKKPDPMSQALLRLSHYSTDDSIAVLDCMSPNTRKKYKSILEHGTRILALPSESEDAVPLGDWFADLLKCLLGDEYGLLQ